MNAEIIQHDNGDCSVKLLPTYENEKFILDVMAVIDTMKSHIAECVARNTQVNVEYGELCKSYDQLKAQVADNSYLDQIGSLQYENKKLDGLAELYNKQRQELQNANNELNDRLRTHKNVIAHLEEQRNNLKNDNEAGSEAIDQLNKEVISLRSENEKLKTHANKWMADASELSIDSDTWYTYFMESAKLATDRTNENKELKAENAELKRQLAAMTKTVFGNDNTKGGVYVDCPFHKANCYKDTCIVHGTCVAQNENDLP